MRTWGASARLLCVGSFDFLGGSLLLTHTPSHPTQTPFRCSILIGIHGAAMNSIMYLPANAVVIEIFPAFYRPTMYGTLAARLGLRYYPLLSPAPSGAADAVGEPRSDGLLWEKFEQPAVRRFIDGNDTHVSHAMGAYSTSGVLVTLKDAYAKVDLQGLSFFLKQALDDIGCRDSICASPDGQAAYVNLKARGRQKRRDD